MSANTIPLPAPGTIICFSDLLCPFAHLALRRLRAARSKAGLDGRVDVEHHVFPLELFNGPHQRPHTDREAAVLARLVPDAGFGPWYAPDWMYPNTVALAHEAVRAAQRQGLGASEQLDAALRRAFWSEGRPIAHRGVVLEIASSCGIDAEALADALDHGRVRSALFDDWQIAKSGAVKGSPHFFFADGTDSHNPGMRVRMEGPADEQTPVVDHDDPSVWDELVRKAMDSAA